ncbi:hypothetical protein ACC734_38885, partial [Rhizobium ruizarguesonis]
LRLFPLLALFVTAAYLLHIGKVSNVRFHEDHVREYFTMYAFMIHGMIPNSWVPMAASGFLPPAWSISLEWQFYLVAPLLVGLI